MIAHFFTAPFVLGEYGLAFGKSLFCFRALGSRLAHDNIAVRKNVPSIQRTATAIAGYIERSNHSAAIQRIMANAPPSQLRNKFNPQQSKKIYKFHTNISSFVLYSFRHSFLFSFLIRQETVERIN